MGPMHKYIFSCYNFPSMATGGKDRKIIAKKKSTLQIPIFFKVLVSMMFVSTIPIILLGMVSFGGTQSITASIGTQNSIFLITIITLTIIMMWSLFLANSITRPIIELSKAATRMSMGEPIDEPIAVGTNDEIGELADAFNRMAKTYRILDKLAQHQDQVS